MCSTLAEGSKERGRWTACSNQHWPRKFPPGPSHSSTVSHRFQLIMRIPWRTLTYTMLLRHLYFDNGSWYYAWDCPHSVESMLNVLGFRTSCSHSAVKIADLSDVPCPCLRLLVVAVLVCVLMDLCVVGMHVKPHVWPTLFLPHLHIFQGSNSGCEACADSKYLSALNHLTSPWV